MELDKRMSENGEEETRETTTKKRQLGGIKTMPFILGEFNFLIFYARTFLLIVFHLRVVLHMSIHHSRQICF